MTAHLIILDQLRFNDSGFDANGSRWTCSELDGWDSPDLRQSVGEATGRHGGVLQSATLGPRAVIAKGMCRAVDTDSAWVAHNELLGVTNNLVRPRDLVVDEDAPKRLGYVRGGRPRIRWHGDRVLQFELPLLALDPLKYTVDPVQVTIGAGETADVATVGTFATEPTITAAGLVDLRHVASGLRLVTDKAVPSGTVFDAHDRTVLAGSADWYDAMPSASMWWAVQPGTNTIRNLGDSPATLTYHHAYL